MDGAFLKIDAFGYQGQMNYLLSLCFPVIPLLILLAKVQTGSRRDARLQKGFAYGVRLQS